MTSPARKTRLVARIPPAIRKTIEAAAESQGTSLNQFVVQAALREANEILERETLVRLNHEQSAWMFALIEEPPKPNPALVAARSRHRKLVRARG